MLNDRQYGFHKGRSTDDLLTLLSEKWNGSIHRFGEAKDVALYISKAYRSHFSRFISILKLLDRIQKRAKVLINDNIDSLEHRSNVACISLFYRYYNGRCSREIRGLIPNNQIFSHGTRTKSTAQCITGKTHFLPASIA